MTCGNLLKQLALWACIALLAAACRPDGRVDALPYQAEAGGGWGLMGTDGRPVVPAGHFSRPPSVAVDGLFCVPDSDGMLRLHRTDEPDEPVCPRRFARIGHFFEQVTVAQETPQSPFLLIDKEGNTVASTAQYPQYDIALMHNFCEGRALIATREGKYGYLDTRGEIVVPPLYDHAYDYCDGVALVGITNPQGATGYQLIDRQGRPVMAIQLNNCHLGTAFSEERLPYKDLGTGQCGYLDERGVATIYLPSDVKEAYAYSHGRAIYQTTTGTGVVDHRGNISVPAKFENIAFASKSRMAVKQKGQWAVAKNNGTLLCPLQYDSIGRYYGGRLAVARKDGRCLFVDRQGKPHSPDTYAALLESAEANRLTPQVFIRQEEDGTPDDGGINPPQPETPETPGPAPAATQQAATAVPRQSLIRTDDWQRIGRQNPFYEEARKVASGKLEENDANRRKLILNYVEHLRTSYTTKDIDFLQQLFSENALIVVGTVVHTSSETAGNYLSPTQVVYNIRSKNQYMEQLKRVFQANRTIDVQFSNFRIMRHPTVPGIYGVSLRQGYRSDRYSDDGYLFLLWDFRDESAPKIHVRTWQPSLTDDHTPLGEDEILDIRNFNLQ